MAEDALQRRIASFVAEAKAPYSVNGTADISLGTCIGAVREQNQDRALITFASYPTAPEKSFAIGIVSDGMGGLLRGDEAAVIAVSVFASRVIQWPSQPTPDRLRWAALAENQAVYKSLDGRGGATLSAVMVGPRGAVVGVNAGDSRILITSDGVHCASPATFAQAARAPTISLNEALGGHDNGTALVLPTRFAAPDADSEQGLNLTFWSPSDRLEIWIPAL